MAVVRGPKIAVKLAESGQLVAKAWDWLMPREMGKVRAAAQAAVVQAWERVSGAAVMKVLMV